jgi:hypothetical protein
LNTTPTDEKTLRNRPPHSGHCVKASSLKDWTASNRWPHAVQA